MLSFANKCLTSWQVQAGRKHLHSVFRLSPQWKDLQWEQHLRYWNSFTQSSGCLHNGKIYNESNAWDVDRRLSHDVADCGEGDHLPKWHWVRLESREWRIGKPQWLPTSRNHRRETWFCRQQLPSNHCRHSWKSFDSDCHSLREDKVGWTNSLNYRVFFVGPCEGPTMKCVCLVHHPPTTTHDA